MHVRGPGGRVMARRFGFNPDWVVAPGETLREWRESNHLPPKAAATACAGMPFALYARVENGSERITENIAAALAHGEGHPGHNLAQPRTHLPGRSRGRKDVAAVTATARNVGDLDDRALAEAIERKRRLLVIATGEDRDDIEDELSDLLREQDARQDAEAIEEDRRVEQMRDEQITGRGRHG